MDARVIATSDREDHEGGERDDVESEGNPGEVAASATQVDDGKDYCNRREGEEDEGADVEESAVGRVEIGEAMVAENFAMNRDEIIGDPEVDEESSRDNEEKERQDKQEGRRWTGLPRKRGIVNAGGRL